MPDSPATPYFVTHREMNALVGERRRLRWEKDELLPEPDWLRVDRSRLGVYPQLVLARVVVGRTKDPNERRALEDVLTSSRRLLTTDGYHRFRVVAREVLSMLSKSDDDWSFETFLSLLSESDPKALESWRADVSEVEEGLTAKAALTFRSTLGTVRDQTPDGYMIMEAGGSERRIRQALAKLEVGTNVVLERVGVESKEREFVLPALPVGGGFDVVEELRLQDGGERMDQHIDPFQRIAAREPFSAVAYLGISGEMPALNIRAEFERGHIPGLLPTEEVAHYVEPEQIFSFAFDSSLLDTRVPA